MSTQRLGRDVFWIEEESGRICRVATNACGEECDRSGHAYPSSYGVDYN